MGQLGWGTSRKRLLSLSHLVVIATGHGGWWFTAGFLGRFGCWQGPLGITSEFWTCGGLFRLLRWSIVVVRTGCRVACAINQGGHTREADWTWHDWICCTCVGVFPRWLLKSKQISKHKKLQHGKQNWTPEHLSLELSVWGSWWPGDQMVVGSNHMTANCSTLEQGTLVCSHMTIGSLWVIYGNILNKLKWQFMAWYCTFWHSIKWSCGTT